MIDEPLNASLKKINDLAVPLAKQMGLEILLIEETSERGRRILRIFLEHSDPAIEVNVEECAQFSRSFGTILDVEAEISGAYDLEVSSPGLNRPLVKPEHFRAQVGEVLKVQTFEPVGGPAGDRRHFHGTLLRVTGEGEAFKIYLQVDGKEYEIPFSQIKKAHLDYFATQEYRLRKH